MDSSGRLILLVRHGETEWSTSGRHTGYSDIPLTDRGREQARALARSLGGRRLARVLTSPLSRSTETCRLAGLAAVAETTDDLREWNYGDYEGRTTPEIREDDPGWTIWSRGAPGGETPDEVGERADRVLAAIADAEGDVALFAHGHILRALAARWLELPTEHGRRLALDTATLSALGWERDVRVIRLWNESPAGL